MRIIQSLWSGKQTDLLKHNAGWASPEYHLMSWALSCLQLTQFYDNVTLYTDSASAGMLIDKLKLPYAEVVCNLDKLNKYDPGLWALAKIDTYQQQEKPFLHVDGDVFIWKAFDQNLLSGDLIAQNKEAATDYYEKIMLALETSLSYFPQEIIDDRNSNKLIYAFNAGILGGNDIPFFKEYTSKAFEFVERNAETLGKINLANFNIFFEQYLFYCLAKIKKNKVSLLDNNLHDDNGYRGFGDFHEVPHNRQYLHLLGTYKRNRRVCNQMAFTLRKYYPDYYYRIVQLFRDNQLPLVRDYYYWLPAKKDEDLLARYHLYNGEFYHTNNSTDVKNDAIFFEFPRTKILKEYFNQRRPVDHHEKAEVLIKDVTLFENSINDILTTKFAQIDKESLYQRDIICTRYIENVFGSKGTIYQRSFVASDNIEIVDPGFDWTLLDVEADSMTMKMEKVIASGDEPVKLVVIPECDKTGYSLILADELDVSLLQLLAKPFSVAAILVEIAKEFDEEELKNAYADFEHLIFGRIKLALLNRLVKLI